METRNLNQATLSAHAPTFLDSESTNPALARLVEQAATRLQSGEPFDFEEFVAEHQHFGQELRDIFPLVASLVEAGGAKPIAGVEPAGFKGHSATNVELGGFRLIREIGRGGMGIVYEAEQISLGRRVALKLLPFAAIADSVSLRRFRNEVRAAAALDHPNIVSIYSVGEDWDVHYYAMQLIRGRSLAELIDELRCRQSTLPSPILQCDGLSNNNAPTTALDGREPANTTVIEIARTATLVDSHQGAEHFRSTARLGIQAAEALQHAHDQGVLHRDVKPSNLMLDADNNLYVTDFGLARTDADAGLTATGEFIGTLRYMSPEQILAQGVIDHRTDVYSLGVTLYELVTLEPAFQTCSRGRLIHDVVFKGVRRPRSVNPHVPLALDAIIRKATESDLAERYPSAVDMADDLRKFLNDEPVKARRRRPRKVFVALLAAGLAIACAGIFILIRDQFGNEKSRLRFENGDAIEIVETPAALDSAAPPPQAPRFSLSFDGKDDFVTIPKLIYDGRHPVTIDLRTTPSGQASFRQLVLVSNFALANDQACGISLFQRGDKYPQPNYVSWAMAYAAENGHSHSLIAAPDAWRVGRPTQIAFVAEGRRYRFYFDGKLWKHGELGDQPAISDQPFMIGGHDVLKGFYQGTIDEIRFSNVARYSTDFMPVTRFENDVNTMALYHCDEGQDSILVDSSGNGHHGEINGASWVASE
jgi:serine/threonine protein kinase